MSLFAFLAALVLAQRNTELRTGYAPALVPAGLLGWVAFATAILAWTIVVVGRVRPSGFWPRAWSLAMAIVATLAALVPVARLAWPAPAQVNALTTAALAAILALAPRLLWLSPSSNWSERIAPLTLLAILVLLTPLTLPRQGLAESMPRPDGTTSSSQGNPKVVGSSPTAATREAYARFLASSRYDWSDFRQDTAGAAAAVEGIRALREIFAALPEAWRMAPKTERGALVEAAGSLMRAVSQALDPDRVAGLPSVASLGLGPDRFSEHIRIAASYYAAVGELLQSLTPLPNNDLSDELARLDGEARRLFNDNLRRIRAKWSDTWVARAIPVGLLGGIDPDPSIRDLLASELFRDEQRTYRANEIDALWGIDLARARRLQPSGRNPCGGRPGTDKDEYRVDCYAFRASADGETSRLAAELRIVYKGRRKDAPVELWYAFPIPESVPESNRPRWRKDTLDELLRSVQQARPDLRVSSDSARLAVGSGSKGGPAWRVASMSGKFAHLDGRPWFVVRFLEEK